MAVRIPRRVRTLALADKKNAMGQDCRGLAGGSRGYRKPTGQVAARSKKLSPLGPPGLNRTRLMVYLSQGYAVAARLETRYAGAKKPFGASDVARRNRGNMGNSPYGTNLNQSWTRSDSERLVGYSEVIVGRHD